jgi:indole-3-glycerol phosphate synthase
MNQIMNILDKIIARKKIEVQEKSSRESLDSLKQRLAVLESNRSLRKKLDKDPGFHFICEIKKASPSKGLIRADFNPERFARLYEDGGASAISVLTDQDFFQGNLDYLKLVKKTVKLPVLRKDFIIDPYQIYESKLYGADIVLLIARILTKEQLNDYIDLAARLNLDVLIEFAEEKEIEKFSNGRDNVILGINNRNLNTFEVDFQNSYHLKGKLPAGLPIIAESGIRDRFDCNQLKNWGFSGALIGETLMKSSNPEELLKQFIREVESVNPA